MAAGQALLAMAGPIGWSIAGASLLTSIMLFKSKAKKLGMQKKEEIESVIRNTESIKEADAKIKNILDKTVSLRDLLNEQYSKCLNLFGKDFLSM